MSPVSWQQLAGGSRIRQAVLLLGCLALLLGAAYFGHLQSLFVSVDMRAEQALQLRVEQADKAGQVQALATSQAQLEGAYRALAESRWRLAAGGEMAGLLEDIAHQGHEQGVFVVQLELLPEVLHDHHIELPIQLSLQGTYSALAAFARDLAQLPRLITLHDFSLAPGEANNPAVLRLQIQARAYRASSAAPAPAAFEPSPARLAPTFSRSPFEPTLVQYPREFLERLPLEQFEMVGSLGRSQDRFALLRAAGIVHRLALGDRLGRDKGRIVAIEEGRVEILEEVFVTGKGWVERHRSLSLKPGAG